MGLPEGLDGIFLWSYQFTPSVTAVVASCALTDDLAASLDPVLERTDFTPLGTRHRRGWSIQPPANVKRFAVDGQRVSIRRVASDWLATALPGAFASDGSGALPTVEVIVVDKGDPFVREPADGFLDFLHLGWDPTALRSDGLTGWVLSFDREERAVATLAARRADVVDEKVIKHSSDGWYFAQSLLDAMLEDVVSWGASELLAEAQRRLAAVRDDLPVARGKRAVRRLKRIRGVFLQDSLDTRTLADEFSAYAKIPLTRMWMSAGWSSKEPNLEWSLAESIRSNLRVRSAVLAASERRLREAVSAETNVVSAIANLRAQRYFGWAALAVAVVVALHPNIHHLVEHLGGIPLP
jgi:hypothetical protein